MPEEPFAVRTNITVKDISVYPNLYDAIKRVKTVCPPTSVCFNLCYYDKEIRVDDEVYSKKAKVFSDEEISKAANEAKKNIDGYMEKNGIKTLFGRGLRCSFWLREGTNDMFKGMLSLDSLKDNFTIDDISKAIDENSRIDVWLSDEELEKLNPDRPIIISDGIRKLEIED